MRSVSVTTWKDLQRLRRDPTAIISSMAIPLVITFLLALLFGTGNATPKGKLLIVDHDHSFLSMLLAGSFDQGAVKQLITVETLPVAQVSPEDTELRARERIDRDQVSAVL